MCASAQSASVRRGHHCSSDPVVRPGRYFAIVKDTDMNWDRIEGNWKQFKGNVKEKWGKLTDDQLDVIAGKRDHLAGRIQESYGITKDETEKQLADWQTYMDKTYPPK